MDKILVFGDTPVWKSQQTIVKLLKKVKYHFEPVCEYEHTQFYCVTEQRKENPVQDGFMKFLRKIFPKMKPVKEEYADAPLALTICGEYRGVPLVEPIVFTRDDVMRIIADTPETYNGTEIL